MPNPYGLEPRECAVAAYEAGEGSYADIADRFSVAKRTLGTLGRARPAYRICRSLSEAGGWHSPIDVAVMHAVVRERSDRTTEELTRAYKRLVPVAHQVHRSSFLRALQRAGYVFKKRVPGPQNTVAPKSTPPAKRSARG